MKDNKLSFLKNSTSFSDNTGSLLLKDSEFQVKSTNTNHLKILHAFTNRMNYLREEVNRLNFIMAEIHSIVKTRFQ